MKSNYISNSADETIAIGESLAKTLEKGDVVSLVGELGSGKTVLTKGIAKGLGVKNPCYVNSPTFVVIKEYKGRLPLYHFDLYRLYHPSLFDSENYREHFYGECVSVIEWADKIRPLLPSGYIEVRLAVIGENEREIEIKKC